MRKLLLRPWVSIQELLEGAPVVTTHWSCSRKDDNLIRFGLMWQCYDMVASLGLDYMPGVLPSSECLLPGGFLCGGAQGTSFLVSVEGLEHPLADEEVVFSEILSEIGGRFHGFRYNLLDVH